MCIPCGPEARRRSPTTRTREMDRNEFDNVALLAIRPSYRDLYLKANGKKSPFIIMLNPSGVHYQFVALDLDNAAAAQAAGNAVDVFLVDSLRWDLAEVKATKFFILAAIHFIKMGLEWMNTFVNEKGLAKKVSDAIPDHTSFLEELKVFNMNVKEISLDQDNDYDCGIFTILQMNRLSRYLGRFAAGEKLLLENVSDCLNQTIDGSKPPHQGYVDKWRTSEFLYLLSVWIKHVSKMIKEAGSLKDLNKTLETNFKRIVDIPYLGVNYERNEYYVKAVDYYNREIQVATSDSHEKIIKLREEWWIYMKFISSPTATNLPEQLKKMPLKEPTDAITYVPSTSDLCKFYPGHGSNDKYLASDYIFWKLQMMDKRIVGSNNPTAIVGLCINSFHVDKAARFLKKRKRTGGKRTGGKRTGGISDDSDPIDLISDED